MLNKDDMVALLRDAAKREEDIVLLYAKHINSTLFLSGLKEDKAMRIQCILERLAADSKKHAAMLGKLASMVRAGQKNVY